MTDSAQPTDDNRVLLLAAGDNIAVALREIPAGTTVTIGGVSLALGSAVDVGHKFAVRAIAAGEQVVKYGVPIGRAIRAISTGDYVHLHNLQSEYIPTWTLDAGHRFPKEGTQ